MRILSRRWPAILLLAAVSCTARDAAAQSRMARTIRFDTATGQATVAVLLPAGYDSTTLRYPVLYLLHGGTQNHTAFPARSGFTRDASERRMIVVMPHLQPFLFAARGDEPAPVEHFHGWEVWDPQVRAFFDVLATLPGWSPQN